MKKRINIITLGCSKNLVDSEVLMKQLDASGYKVFHDENFQETDIVVINTCGFIGDAKKESVDTILQCVAAKEKGKIRKLFVMGCLSERYKEDLRNEIPEVDGFFGVNQLADILKSLKADYKKELIGERILATPGHFAYLKISEGCNRSCSFCAIPLIRGKHISRPIDKLIEEVNFLAEKGVKELILIAQDLSYYGLDLYKKQNLDALLKKLAEVRGIEWIRLHYLYPANFPYEILPVINEHENICKYLDVALQHISNPVLKNMRRGITSKQTYSFIEKLRKEIPGIRLRTSLMTGHPGEGKKEFEELKKFVKEIAFDRLGVFVYSEEEGTFSAKNFKDSISLKVKKDRMAEIMQMQQEISEAANVRMIGTQTKVLIDREDNDYYYGRTEFDSPEIDNEVLIKKENKKFKTGNFYNVSITGAEEFDLFGKV
ncbi:MAG: ribosomal protein S12 methylthiotransferase RimO [Bacteroidetes bacterium RIFOXYA12_FULL_35_11]|nr:MAG: ribosomal protein S12 methylthiotransferase RimO [Bacteroidetes bacterium GWF2_35_48]OFY78685.1 MAG: ribosomal protein S12 methylthiotransferase RimO [Bacteroidetes bacterium RIFOXYA12_FULL_35_11]HBX53509.1 30S ribosomal protein S12 methylthiotransferase RimO [Bacteroidales bacterium]